ncbi:MAG: sensor domain-containing diguanylate cyclase [Peptococcaceae bacterium]|nr:sensor domain-containing diguanylate cyclase [Peptococcaceae bacterium]
MKTSVYDVMCNFFHYYLTECSVEKTLELMSDEFFFVSGRGNEFALTKAESKKRLEIDFEQRKDMQLCYAVNKYKQMKGDDKTYICWGKLTIQSTSQTVRMEPVTMMVTVGLRWENDTYRVFYLQQEKIYELRKTPQTLFSREKESVLLQAVQDFMPGNKLGGYWEENLPFDVVNKKMLDELGYTYDELLEVTGGYLKNIIHPDDYQGLWQEMEEAFQEDKTHQKALRMRKKNGEYYWVYSIGKKIVTDDKRQMFISGMLDISENPFFTEKQHDESNRDYLTGLYNRRYARTLINEQLSSGIPYGLLLLDIDKFRQLNDIYGHYVGDDVLILLSEVLQKYTRDGDVCVRLGGDEFLAFFPYLHEGEVLKLRAAQINFEFKNSLDKLCPHNQSDGLTIAGIYGNETATLEKLYRKADEILYQIKECYTEQVKIEVKALGERELL